MTNAEIIEKKCDDIERIIYIENMLRNEEFSSEQHALFSSELRRLKFRFHVQF